MNQPNFKNQNIDIILYEPGFTRMFEWLAYIALAVGVISIFFGLATAGTGVKPGAILVIIQSLAILTMIRVGKLKWAAVFVSWFGTLSVLPAAYFTLGLTSIHWGVVPMLILCGSWLLGKRTGLWLAVTAAGFAVVLYILHKSGHTFSHTYPPEVSLATVLALLTMAVVMGGAGAEAFERKFKQLQESRQRLVRSEAQLFALFDSTEDLIWSVEADTYSLVKFNAALSDYFYTERGIDIESGMTPDELFGDEVRARDWKALCQRAINEGRCSGEMALTDADQTFHLTFNRIMEQGTPLGVAVFAKNITEQIQNEEMRVNEYAFQNQLIESIPGIFYLFDSDGRFLMWNKNLLTVLGVTSHELVKRHPLDFIPADQQDQVRHTIAQVFREGASHVEADLLNGSGRRIPYLLSGYRLEWRGSASLLGVGLDISERKAAEQVQARHQAELENQVTERTRELSLAKNQADVANQAKSSFLANMSHEIRTPLTAIVGFSESLLQQELTGDERDQAIQTVIRNGRHLQGLISNILDFSKIEAGRLEIEHTVFDLAAFLADILSLGQAQARIRQIEFSVHLLSPLPIRVRSDLTRIRQILINLIGNALKFTHTGGRVRLLVSYDPANTLLLFTVQDSGIGIEDESVRELFKPFVQADVSTTRRFGGTGLGLSISRELARLLGGDIQVFSIKSLGSLFTVSLSAGQPDEIELTHEPEVRMVQAAAPERNNEIPRLAGHILVAEDTPDTQQLITLLLRRTGIRFTLVNNGQEALGAVQVAEFDLVLIDMQMPIMGGLEAVSLIRLTGFVQPIIALTANATEAYRAEARAAGCDDFLTKPIDQTAFFSALERYLPDKKSMSAHEDQAATGSLYEDPRYLSLKAAFIEELPGRLSGIAAASDQQNWDELGFKLHQLKGIAGSFGFPELSRMAGQIEFGLQNQEYQLVAAAVKTLIEQADT